MRCGKPITALLTAAILACAASISGAQGGAALAHADDLAATAFEARKRGVPILLAFTESSCPYCTRARNDYLIPLQTGSAYGTKVLIREIDIRSAGMLRDFAGVPASRAAFARRYGVTKVPTVVVVDFHGNPLADAIVGLLGEDFYLAYLEQAIDAGRLKLRKK
jgi:thioredoxin-related protein